MPGSRRAGREEGAVAVAVQLMAWAPSRLRPRRRPAHIPRRHPAFDPGGATPRPRPAPR